MTCNLYLVVLGGRINGCNIELHDVRWVVGESIEDTVISLKQQMVWEIKRDYISIAIE
jgi:hypothetical protein